MYSLVRFDKSRVEDFFRIFDRSVSGGVVCYCTMWNMTQEEIDRRIVGPVKNNTAQLSQVARKVAEEMINADRIHGFLFYEDGTPVGWCNCDDKCNYTFLARHVPAATAEKDHIRSIVCLKVVGEKDFCQVGSALVEAVCRESGAEGYPAVEAYPHEGAMTCADFHSVMKVYSENGFELLSLQDGAAVLRKEL